MWAAFQICNIHPCLPTGRVLRHGHFNQLSVTATQYRESPLSGVTLRWSKLTVAGTFEAHRKRLYDLQRLVAELWGWVFFQEKLQSRMRVVEHAMLTDTAIKLDHFMGVIIPWGANYSHLSHMFISHGLPTYWISYIDNPKANHMLWTGLPGKGHEAVQLHRGSGYREIAGNSNATQCTYLLCVEEAADVHRILMAEGTTFNTAFLPTVSVPVSGRLYPAGASGSRSLAGASSSGAQPSSQASPSSSSANAATAPPGRTLQVSDPAGPSSSQSIHSLPSTPAHGTGYGLVPVGYLPYGAAWPGPPPIHAATTPLQLWATTQTAWPSNNQPPLGKQPRPATSRGTALGSGRHNTRKRGPKPKGKNFTWCKRQARKGQGDDTSTDHSTECSAPDSSEVDLSTAALTLNHRSPSPASPTAGAPVSAIAPMLSTSAGILPLTPGPHTTPLVMAGTLERPSISDVGAGSPALNNVAPEQPQPPLVILEQEQLDAERQAHFLSWGAGVEDLHSSNVNMLDSPPRKCHQKKNKKCK
ncbi:hypothetical protein BOTBODRAFT_44765 [Botryobasidium botryosum FD-172 SS1]|uniref:Uncharacterized protein n=1 Tax=Botryobasidium botryosum (strain FD-172 SS1) TaxID=930990 RepID=A0A067MR71_BOTB1|nr:hypothetical protein BOTBODRAFT_44765 [Botryobasidium botryosum FD-172 SS1]